jgi:hypothetical protein
MGYGQAKEVMALEFCTGGMNIGSELAKLNPKGSVEICIVDLTSHWYHK